MSFVRTVLRYFWFSLAVSMVLLGAVFVFGGWAALFLALLLVVLEVTLSFDNAVVNARVLERMTPLWQRRFLTWGILIAVFGTRFVLPIIIVSAVVWASPWYILNLALFDPAHYGELLEGAAHAIHAFGATFLLLVALKYFFDTGKTVHWIAAIERRLTLWGAIESIEIIIALGLVTALSFIVPDESQTVVLLGSIVGALLFLIMRGVTSAFSTFSLGASSAGLFVYLEVLDAAFSLDGVIGAFALTSSILIIAAGLGIGALFVRSLTIFMVRQKTLDTLVFLEHGAHWAIFGLAGSMFASLLTEVPEVVTGTIGIGFLVAAYYSSLVRGSARERGEGAGVNSGASTHEASSW